MGIQAVCKVVQKQEEGEEAEEAKCCQKVEKEDSWFQTSSAQTEEQSHGFFHKVEIHSPCRVREHRELLQNKGSFSTCLGIFLKDPMQR